MTTTWALGIEHDGPRWHVMIDATMSFDAGPVVAVVATLCGAPVIDAEGWTRMAASPHLGNGQTACEECALQLQRRHMSSREAADQALRARDRDTAKRGFISGARKKR